MLKINPKLLIIAVLLLGGIALFPGISTALEVDYPVIPGFGDLNVRFAQGMGIIDIFYFLFVVTLWISGLLAFGVLVVAGFFFATSSGNPQKRGEAKKRIVALASGILILLLSYVILQTINPQLTKLGVGAFKICYQRIDGQIVSGFVECASPTYPETPGGAKKCPDGNAVCLYDNVEFNKELFAIGGPETPGTSYNIGNLGNWGDKTQAVKVRQGYKVAFYEHNDYDGSNITIYYPVGGVATTCTNQKRFALGGVIRIIDPYEEEGCVGILSGEGMNILRPGIDTTLQAPLSDIRYIEDVIWCNILPGYACSWLDKISSIKIDHL